MMTLRHIAAAEVRHQQRERERDKTRKRRKGNLTKREKQTGISSIIGFDNATSSFLTLLINRSYKKLKKAKSKGVFMFSIKKVRTIFYLESSVK